EGSKVNPSARQSKTCSDPATAHSESTGERPSGSTPPTTEPKKPSDGSSASAETTCRTTPSSTTTGASAGGSNSFHTLLEQGLKEASAGSLKSSSERKAVVCTHCGKVLSTERTLRMALYERRSVGRPSCPCQTAAPASDRTLLERRLQSLVAREKGRCESLRRL